MDFRFSYCAVSPFEATEKTGVSANARRQYRHRGLLPTTPDDPEREGGRVAFSEIVALSVMGELSRAGVTLKRAMQGDEKGAASATFARVRSWVLIHALNIEGAIRFDVDCGKVAEKALDLLTLDEHPDVFALFPTAPDDGPLPVRFGEDINGLFEAEAAAGARSCIVVDLRRLAHDIAERLPRPIVAIVPAGEMTEEERELHALMDEIEGRG